MNIYRLAYAILEKLQMPLIMLFYMMNWFNNLIDFCLFENNFD